MLNKQMSKPQNWYFSKKSYLKSLECAPWLQSESNLNAHKNYLLRFSDEIHCSHRSVYRREAQRRRFRSRPGHIKTRTSLFLIFSFIPLKTNPFNFVKIWLVPKIIPYKPDSRVLVLHALWSSRDSPIVTISKLWGKKWDTWYQFSRMLGTESQKRSGKNKTQTSEKISLKASIL